MDKHLRKRGGLGWSNGLRHTLTGRPREPIRHDEGPAYIPCNCNHCRRPIL